ncbi:MAG: hypothetical protein ACP5RM_02885 [Candidatus Micrarchaeia archaeon]
MLVVLPAALASLAFFGVIAAFFVFAISVLAAILLSTIESIMERGSLHVEEMRRFSSSMRIISDSMASGKSTMRALDNAALHQSDNDLKHLLETVKRRMALGSPIDESIENIFSPYRTYALRFAQAIALLGDASSAASSTNEIMKREYMKELSRREGSMQKYITSSMLFSSVVPSFLLFSFTGYSLMGGKGFQGISLFLLLCIAVPFAYGLISFRIGDLYG